MTTITEKVTNPVSNYPSYLAYGAAGGYIGAYVMARWHSDVENIDPFGTFMIQSAVAGSVGTYLWVLAGPSGADFNSVLKGMLVGALGEWVYNRFLKIYVASWSAALL